MKQHIAVVIATAGFLAGGLSQTAFASADQWVIQMQVIGSSGVNSVVALSGTKTGSLDGLDANDALAPPPTLNADAPLVLNNMGGLEYLRDYKEPLTEPGHQVLLIWQWDIYA